MSQEFQLTPEESVYLMQALTRTAAKLLILASTTPQGELFSQYMAMIEDAQAVLDPIAKRIEQEIDG